MEEEEIQRSSKFSPVQIQTDHLLKSAGPVAVVRSVHVRRGDELWWENPCSAHPSKDKEIFFKKTRKGLQDGSLGLFFYFYLGAPD